MVILNRWSVLVCFVGILCLSMISAGGHIGTSYTSVNGEYSVAASSSLMSTLIGIGLAFFVFYYPQQKCKRDNEKVVGIWRRGGAFCIDSIAIMTSVIPIIVLPVLIAEYQMTGKFAWAFGREFTRPSDVWCIIPGILFLFFILLYYFYWHLYIHKQTLGQYILGFNFYCKDNLTITKKQAGIRTMLSVIAGSIWPVSIMWSLKNRSRYCWHDYKTEIYPVRVDYV